MQLKKMRLTGITRAALVGVVLVVVVAAAMLVARRGPAVLAKMSTAGKPAQAAPAPANKVSAPEAKAAGRVKPTTPARAAVTTPGPKPALVLASATTTPAAAPAAAPANVAATEAALEVVTITGCLQHDDGEFLFKDTVGVNAPKSRSWKSGFLKKRAASVEIVDSANRLRLPTHVGQKVSITGIMLDREMRARSVQRVGVCS